MANEIARFGGLNFLKYILSELIVKFVVRVHRIVRILEDQWKWL